MMIQHNAHRAQIDGRRHPLLHFFGAGNPHNSSSVWGRASWARHVRNRMSVGAEANLSKMATHCMEQGLTVFGSAHFGFTNALAGSIAG
ncbi:MAG: hypothetical protein DI603_05115 [Roseateles depolymerans]|uniref:Uncharacterized protein n=1 Tax=Roseateles depolymerans TaxID=76731 RepID=A0A2W5FTH9_9BURK|nr:MAG: hypothetical protein DI603_05115 [Roseateles depolymerans]